MLKRQRGVAVITALLLTTLAITIVASLFWQQQVQVRSIENQRLQLQKQWILRGALDWALLILREDANTSPVVDLTGAWAVPLADTKLDQYVENARTDNEPSEASLSGQIVDATSRYNLGNLATNGVITPREVAVFSRLLVNLRLNPALAKAAADAVAAAQPPAPALPGTPTPPVSSKTSTMHRPLGIEYADDLLSVPGFTPEILAKIKDFVIVLPGFTAINANTAPAQVLAARIDNITLSDATTLISSRDHASFRDKADLESRLPGKPLVTVDTEVSLRSDYFLVNGKVSLSRASLSIQALINRGNMMSPAKTIWIREN